MKLTKSKLKQLIKEELALFTGLEVESNFIKKNKLHEASWAERYEALETKTLEKLEDDDADVLEILVGALDGNWWLMDEDDQTGFIWDIISSKPELGDAQVWVDDVFEKLRDEAYKDHLSQLEDEATNPS